ncbi:MAG TPA: FKBP-type peptidyl-prolyl cis-trans isomerase [Solirubrobacteraceae bacterium]|nr:FKBP-type peptidyl-prolyl cis-trans isomerase [Solirubrobacteraceae bacterium]
MSLRHALLAALTTAALAPGLAACGDDDDEEPAAGGTGPAASATATEAETTDVPPEKDLDVKPTVEPPRGQPPKRLVKEDIVVGTGPAVSEGDLVTVHYVGVNYSNGQQFDASWDNGAPVQFQLASGRLIEGWVRGMQGMKVGGRRKLIIPPRLGYGAQGSGAIPPNETLIFVIDLKQIG